ncbi:FAD dependent oxidoreductase [Tremella mesenterica]|uniref:L-2-hydroxyglutarate dehydrogenase, mitochondrial n=1 Tax=Tremella mesenterica TaxID=5217 RepID=A0A4Q1BP32_TREME|nr:FAD dependent oxidoreductase [Tremella mesenterica]
MASYAARLRLTYPFKPPSTSIDHIVIGGGVVGLSVAAGLVNVCGKDRTTFVIERRDQLGQETTARNSEVIHSGIYYPEGTLKSRLCIRGREMMYERCRKLGIDHRKTQKLLVATDSSQISYLTKIKERMTQPSFLRSSEKTHESTSVCPVQPLTGDQARELEPDLSSQVVSALLIPETGIVDSQALVDSLAREIEEPEYLYSSNAEEIAVGVDVTGERRRREPGEGVIMLGTRVIRIDKDFKEDGWIVQMETGWEGLKDGEKGQVESVKTNVIVNAAGLGAVSLMEGLVPTEEMKEMWLVKGNYMSYKGPGVENISRLIYPCPGNSVDHLGTHLTIDLSGNIKFGPDVQPIGPNSKYQTNPDFWQSHLTPTVSAETFAKSVQSYLPNIDPSRLTPDYVGFRPNLVAPGQGFSDFHIVHSKDRKGLIELLGFNSPGLTSSLATGEYVGEMVRREVYGLKGLDWGGLGYGWR